MTDPNYANVVERGLVKLLGMSVVEATRERVVATMKIQPQHHQPFGFLHGGVSVALAESVASIGGFLNCPTGKIAMGLEINANHLRSRRDGMITATGMPLHIGRTTQVWEVRITDADEKLVCISRCTRPAPRLPSIFNLQPATP